MLLGEAWHQWSVWSFWMQITLHWKLCHRFCTTKSYQFIRNNAQDGTSLFFQEGHKKTIAMSVFLTDCKFQNNLPTHPFLDSPCVFPLFSPLQISQPFGRRKQLFCVQHCVVLCWPILIGPGKAGNYGRLGRHVSGLSLPFQRLEFSEAPQFVLLFAQE